MITLDGKLLAQNIRVALQTVTAELQQAGTSPTLAVIVATDDADTASYTRAIERNAKEIGITVKLVTLDPAADTATLTAAVRQEADDPAVHGILLQTPLPTGVNMEAIAALIPLQKDVDGVNPLSAGHIASGMPAFAPATAAAVMALLEHYQVPFAGKHAVVVGRSRIVGRPVSQLLLQADATVTICHSKTAHLEAKTKTADILVVAAGRPKLITAAHVHPEMVVIDVGTNVLPDGTVVGDVDSETVADTVAALTPVPGGVGPVTVALLLQHVVAAASQKFSLL